MLTMSADRWIFLFALCFISVSSNDEEDLFSNNACEDYLDECETHTLVAPLRSSVLLPCNFATRSPDSVSWAHTPGTYLIHLTSEGRIEFLDHRYGRVKAFPNQGSEGNFSICIDELKDSDLGCYRCLGGPNCLQVKLIAGEGALSGETRLLIYICVGVAAFILLSAAGYCCMKCILCYKNKTEDNAIIEGPEGAAPGGVSGPAEEPGRAPVDQQHRGAGNDELVYGAFTRLFFFQRL
ncbi:uncharacterized protein LOC131970679 [Centropristis striata]|uniref:uncharacterized protein LOC131970679 n=1 Tax=Centropristis striata TaxID=184440 RepID=UPI0027E16B53|nr:uncharacterized protein LOC131970679 [Centropristis striata]